MLKSSYTVFVMKYKYLVTKKFTGGILKGIVIEEATNVVFKVGFKCPKPSGGSPYEVTKVVTK